MAAVADPKAMATTPEFDEAIDIVSVNPTKAVGLFTQVISKSYSGDEATKFSRMKEQAIYQLGRIYAKQGDQSKVQQLLVDIRPFFQEISKPHSAKIVRTLIDDIATMPKSAPFLISLCQDSIQWAIQEKRSFLRQRLEARLAALYCQTGEYKKSLSVARKLSKELKKLDDKPLLVELEMVESQVYFSLQNVPKAKGALTSARSHANSFYCPPLTQADIDMQGGVLCAAEKDFKTSFSYFYEAYEGYSTGGKDAQAIKALKYMMLSKIMSGLAGDVYNIINSKAGNKYAGSAAQALKAVADASRAKSLSMLEKAFVEHKEELLEDAIVKTHVTGLRNLLLEQNILRVLAPYSRVSIAKVAEHISMETPVVEDYLARMILDKKLHAMIDQTGDIIVSDEEKPDGVYIGAMKLVEELSGVVDTLNARTDSLAAGK